MSETTAIPARPPRAAATVVIARDAPVGIEVLLLRRAERGDHNSGAWVFPGGVVEARDRDWHRCCSGLDDATASRAMGLEAGGLDYLVCAIRESFEECGLLFATESDGRPVALDGERGERIAEWRRGLHRGERSVGELCSDFGLTLAADRLAYFSHWLTPPGRPKRFDTRFFIAAAPASQVASHDDDELVEQLWLPPADALARGDALKLMNPTRFTLAEIARFDSVDALMRWVREPRQVALIMPRVGSGRDGQRPVMPNEFAWAEIGRLDPQGHGHVSYDIVPGTPVALSERVIRITANNGSVMTGPGTNAYLVGAEGHGWAVIDPGPAEPEHIETIVAAAPGPITRIFVTHTHKDHSPGAALLKARTGAPVLGLPPAHPMWQDETFAPDTVLHGGERFALAPGVTLSAIHTPGHASNHLCYLLEEEKTLFTGDHVMQASTVVINPPDGDMAAYVASLRSLLDADLDWLAPGHGFLMAEPRRAFEYIINHRLKREAKVVDALRDLGPEAAIDALLAQVYDDVPPHLHAMATRSLKAHLLKLRDDGRARVAGDERWTLVA